MDHFIIIQLLFLRPHLNLHFGITCNNLIFRFRITVSKDSLACKLTLFFVFVFPQSPYFFYIISFVTSVTCFHSHVLEHIRTLSSYMFIWVLSIRELIIFAIRKKKSKWDSCLILLWILPFSFTSFITLILTTLMEPCWPNNRPLNMPQERLLDLTTIYGMFLCFLFLFFFLCMYSACKSVLWI